MGTFVTPGQPFSIFGGFNAEYKVLVGLISLKGI